MGPHQPHFSPTASLLRKPSTGDYMEMRQGPVSSRAAHGHHAPEEGKRHKEGLCASLFVPSAPAFSLDMAQHVATFLRHVSQFRRRLLCKGGRDKTGRTSALGACPEGCPGLSRGGRGRCLLPSSLRPLGDGLQDTYVSIHDISPEGRAFLAPRAQPSLLPAPFLLPLSLVRAVSRWEERAQGATPKAWATSLEAVSALGTGEWALGRHALPCLLLHAQGLCCPACLLHWWRAHSLLVMFPRQAICPPLPSLPLP